MIKKILVFLIISLAVGNTIAWLSGAAPIEFKEISLSEEDMKSETELMQILAEEPSDFDALLLLGSLYSNHNRIEEANKLLQNAITQKPEDPTALAFYSANNAKRAGAMFDLTMGIYKLHKLQLSIDGLNQAVQIAPNNIYARVTRLITFGYLGKINSSFENVYEDEKWVNDVFHEQSTFPDELYQNVYAALASAYSTSAEDKDAGDKEKWINKSKKYLQQLSTVGGCPEANRAQCQSLLNKFK